MRDKHTIRAAVKDGCASFLSSTMVARGRLVGNSLVADHRSTLAYVAVQPIGDA